MVGRGSAAAKRTGDTPVNWEKWGAIFGFLALLVSYFPAAQQLHWPPYQHSGDPPGSGGLNSVPPTTDTSSNDDHTTDPETTKSPLSSDRTTTPVIPTEQPTDGISPGLTDAERDLLGRIRPVPLQDCLVERGNETGQIVAALACHATQSGPARNVGVFEFAKWSFDGAAVVVSADGSPGPFGLERWWENNAYCVNVD